MPIGLIAPDDMSEIEQVMLYEFTLSMVNSAFAAGYVNGKWHPSDSTCERIRGYHHAGLTPGEAAQIIFGVLQ